MVEFRGRTAIRSSERRRAEEKNSRDWKRSREGEECAAVYHLRTILWAACVRKELIIGSTLDTEGQCMDDAKQLYLDLMKRALTYLIYGQEEFMPVQRPRDFVKRLVFDALGKRGIVPLRRLTVNLENRMEGRDWPAVGLTMIGMKRLNQLQECAEDVLAHNVPGDFIEAGTWRGGAAILLRAILKAQLVRDRNVWVADSFEGLPTPDVDKYPADTRDYDFTNPILAVPLEQVKSNFARFGLLDEQVQFVKGWFRDSLPHLQDETWSVIRLDGDMYESTMDGLKYLYPNLSVGGYVTIDDYGGLQCCREAVHDYRNANKITEEIQKVDWTGVYWRRLKRDSRSQTKDGPPVRD